MELKRMKIKRIFVWKFTLSLFAFGIFLGLICSALLILSSLTGLGQTSFAGKNVDFLKPQFVFVFSLLITGILVATFTGLGFLYALFYNLFSKIGFNIDLGLSEVIIESKPVQLVQQNQISPVQNIQNKIESVKIQPSQNNQSNFY